MGLQLSRLLGVGSLRRGGAGEKLIHYPAELLPGIHTDSESAYTFTKCLESGISWSLDRRRRQPFDRRHGHHAWRSNWRKMLPLPRRVSMPREEIRRQLSVFPATLHRNPARLAGNRRRRRRRRLSRRGFQILVCTHERVVLWEKLLEDSKRTHVKGPIKFVS